MEAASRRHFLAAGAAVAVPMISSAASGKKPMPGARTGLLEDKVAVVYGAAGAMGSAVARAFAREGAHIELAGRTLEKVQALATEIAGAGGSATAAKVDALDQDSIAKHLDTVIASHGRVDISFNLIGLEGPQGESLATMPVRDVVAPVEGAVRTHFLTATAAARHMARQRAGVILALPRRWRASPTRAAVDSGSPAQPSKAYAASSPWTSEATAFASSRFALRVHQTRRASPSRLANMRGSPVCLAKPSKRALPRRRCSNACRGWPRSPMPPCSWRRTAPAPSPPQSPT